VFSSHGEPRIFLRGGWKLGEERKGGGKTEEIALQNASTIRRWAKLTIVKGEILGYQNEWGGSYLIWCNRNR